MDRWAGKITVVTGANSGIGFEIAKALVLKNMIVVGVDIKMEKMENEIKCIKGKGKFYNRCCDISKPESVSELFEWLKKNLGYPRVLVNCAGILLPGRLIDSDSSDWKKVIETNFYGLLNCTQKGILLMKECGEDCYIINICSTTGQKISRKPVIHLQIDPAIKHGVRALARSLEIELIGSKIRITTVCPGFVRTPLMKNNSSLNDLMANNPCLEPVDVAESIVYILSSNPRVQINELTITPFGERQF